MHVIEVEFRLEFRISRACEEIQAAVHAENIVSHFNNRLNGRHHINVIIARAA